MVATDSGIMVTALSVVVSGCREVANVAESGSGPLAVIAQQMNAIRDEFIPELFALMKGEIQGLNHDPRLMEMWRASLTENFYAAVHYLQRDAPTALLEAPAAALAYARASAQRDIPLAPLVRAHRLGHARFLEVAMEYVSLLKPEQQVPTIIELVNRAARIIDLVADQLILAYEEEHDRWLSRRSGLQQHWVNELLDGTPVDVLRAEKVLRYGLDGRHVAAVVWVNDSVPIDEVVARFDEVRCLIGAELDAVGRSLLVPTDEREARLWFSVAGTADLAGMRAAFESAGILARVACGLACDGLRGFRASIKQAELVKAVVLAGEACADSQIVGYDDVAPVALMAGDVGELARFVADALGDLVVDDERNQWLRETLREFLARNRSYVAAAEAMILHRNTIQYRVTQAMERCGQNFDDPDAVFKVQVALEVCRWMAPTVLRAQKGS